MMAQEMTVEDLRAALEQGQRVTVLDIRPTAERVEWSIPQSHHVDAYADLWRGDPTVLQQAAERLPRNAPVVAVCAMGRTSRLAADVLGKMGFDAYSLAGGMRAWSDAWNTADIALPDAGVGGVRGDRCTVVQVRRTGKGCLSYVIGSSGQAAVADPALPPGVYLKLASERGWRIAAIVDTHVHADHVSRAYALSDATGAPVYLPAQQRVRLPFTPLADAQEVSIGSVRIRAIHTPGHTHESTCYAVGQAALITGDTLFLKGVGRPDLEARGDESAVRARLLYRSLRVKVLPLTDTMLVLPGHTSEPIAFDGVPHAAPLRDVRAAAASLTNLDEEAFVAAVLARIPPTPPNHQRIVQINEGRAPAPDDLQALEAGANRCAVSA